jgi:hypothetical protein
MRRQFRTLAMVGVVTLVTAASASAQTDPPAAPPPASSGQLIVERIEDSWLIAPDGRAADLDDRVGSLAGVYGGRVVDRTLLMGAGGYWLANGDDDRRMAYGGAVVEWLIRSDRRIGFGMRTLVGAGSATLPTSFTVFGDDVRHRASRTARFGARTPGSIERTLAVRDDFFIAEPQVNLLLRLASRYRFSVGVGYRVIGAAPVLGDRLEGVSGSLALQIGGR